MMLIFRANPPLIHGDETLNIHRQKLRRRHGVSIAGIE